MGRGVGPGGNPKSPSPGCLASQAPTPLCLPQPAGHEANQEKGAVYSPPPPLHWLNVSEMGTIEKQILEMKAELDVGT